MLKLRLCRWFLVFLLLTTGVMASAEETYTETDYITGLYNILSELDTLIRESGSKDEVVSETYFLVDRMLKENKLSFMITHNYLGLLFAASFNVNDQQRAWLSIDRQLIEAYPTRKALVFAILIHEYRHAYDYFTIDDYVEIRGKNEIENYLYEMEALFLEALFIKHYLNGYPLGNFEQYLLASLEGDDLSGASCLFKQVDKDIVYSIYAMVIGVNEGQVPLADLLQLIDVCLEQSLVDVQKETASAWERYINLIRAYTLHYYLSKLTAALDGRQRSAAEIQEFALFAERANEKLQQLRQFLQQDEVEQFLNNYRQEVLEFMGQ